MFIFFGIFPFQFMYFRACVFHVGGEILDWKFPILPITQIYTNSKIYFSNYLYGHKHWTIIWKWNRAIKHIWTELESGFIYMAVNRLWEPICSASHLYDMHTKLAERENFQIHIYNIWFYGCHHHTIPWPHTVYLRVARFPPQLPLITAVRRSNNSFFYVKGLMLKHFDDRASSR